MDTEISGWILEFIIREPTDDRLANVLLDVLPLPDDDPRLMKTILLRRIRSEVSTGLISERTLESLEMIEDLDYTEGEAVLDSMKAAYCAVAVDCTVRFLREKLDGDDLYFNAVKKIWRRRIHKMKISENVGLASDQLKAWRIEIEAATWDEIVCERILMKDTFGDALNLVRVYLEEAWEAMGPSFLEFAAQTVIQGEEGVRIMDNHLIDCEVGAEAGRLAEVRKVSNSDNGVASGGNCSSMVVVSSEDRHKEMPQSSKLEKTGDGITGNIYDFLPSPEVNRIQEALKSSSMELQALVKDPLPDALDFASRVVSDIGNKKKDIVPSEENQNVMDLEPNCSVHERDGAVEANENVCGDSHAGHQNDVERSSLMERNSTARTCEWDDSSVEGSPEHSRKIHLRSPKKRSLVSPLKKVEINKFARRRKAKKWSSLEEDTLRIGVEKYGRGNWKLILTSYPDIFEERTEVDLKDKWRNMVR
ncbi:uncharacterized protein LOC122084263 [Macadamia integrifolia]|uniref:uncharacterized protein LOC122084263 n=1 Tax=Macadamia integrifolia TaxID=60698 RepID=UPI001C4E6D69|nr:uncharacterized protein LOC122084263 [Macadamia integrifolia]